MTPILAADGSASSDTRPSFTVDLSKASERWRWRCPNGHRGKAWSPTNSHVYCYSCKRQMDAGNDISPEHYELVDDKTGETVPFASLEFIGM